MEEHRKKGISVRGKLVLSYIAMVIIIVCIAIAGIKSISKVYENSRLIYVGNMQSVNYLKTISQNLREEDRDIVMLLSGSLAESQKSIKEDIQKIEKENNEIIDRMLNLEISDNEERRFRQCRLSMLSFSNQIEKLIDKPEDVTVNNLNTEYENDFVPIKATTFEMINAMVVLAEKNASSMNERNKNIYHNLLVVSIIVTFAAFVLAIIIAMLMSNYFNKRLESIQKLAKRISEYDISNDIQGLPDDEFGRTMETLNDSQFMMRNLVEKIIDESTTISDVGKEVGDAIRESNAKVDNINSEIINNTEYFDSIIQKCDDVLNNRQLDSETVEKINNIVKLLKKGKENINDVSGELYSISTYLSQIAITSDYQNELAVSHKDQVQKFKIE